MGFQIVDAQEYVKDPISLEVNPVTGKTKLTSKRWPNHTVFSAQTVDNSPLLKSQKQGQEISIEVENGSAVYRVQGRDLEGRVFCELVMGARKG